MQGMQTEKASLEGLLSGHANIKRSGRWGGGHKAAEKEKSVKQKENREHAILEANRRKFVHKKKGINVSTASELRWELTTVFNKANIGKADKSSLGTMVRIKARLKREGRREIGNWV